jgi:hypothetical protein
MSAFQERDLNKLAGNLAGLVPRPAQIDRDGLLFEAGRRSVRSSRVWIGIACGMTVLAAILAVAILVRPETPHATPVFPTMSPPHDAAPANPAPAVVAPEEKPTTPSPSTGSSLHHYGNPTVPGTALPGAGIDAYGVRSSE